MADLPSSKSTAVTMAPSQTSYQSTVASGSHLNIIAKNSEMMPTELDRVTRCKSHSCTCGAAYFPKAARPAVTSGDTIRRKPIAGTGGKETTQLRMKFHQDRPD